MQHKALGGRVVFHMKARTLEHDWWAAEFHEAVATDEGVGATGLVHYAGLIMATTERIEFDWQGDERPTLVAFQATWEQARADQDHAALWQMWLTMPSEVRQEWERAYEDNRALYGPRWQQPGPELTAEEVAVLDDDDNPFESDAASSNAA